jgi:hypothetical protein
MGTKEDQEVKGNEPDGDDRPATPLHVFMTQWDQHTAIRLAK